MTGSPNPDPNELFSSIEVGASMGSQPERSAQGSAAPPTSPATIAMEELLRELVQQTRQLIVINQEQLALYRRAEERFVQQQKAQRDEFELWLQEHRSLAGRCQPAKEAVRNLMGQAISELVEYAEDNQESLLDSDFVRTEMMDRYGPLLQHVSTMYGLLKRLASIEENEMSGPPPFAAGGPGP